MSLLDNLPHKCTIQRVTVTADGLGGQREARTVVSTGVECWEQQASASQAKEFEKRGITQVHKIYFTTNPNLTEQHEIKITERSGVTQSSPQEFIVLSVTSPDASAGLGVLWRVMVQNMTGANQ